ALASRGRRGAQAREDEHRREERDEQQAQAPKGPTVLHPPPLVDYDVFMQGLVQAMQTQAALQAQAQAPTPVPQEHGHGGPSIIKRFKMMAPPSFKGECQPLLAESWMREVEKIFRAIRCAEEDKVSLATYMLQRFAKQLVVESGVEAEELEVPLSVHTSAGETGVPVLEEDLVRSDSEREELLLVECYIVYSFF
ncbi:hypothetical protein Taro_043260, partial [Colocasia esculenta]|nr:hypothetical protein [Colocasia esculenta]